jgi:hypothetical protein
LETNETLIMLQEYRVTESILSRSTFENATHIGPQYVAFIFARVAVFCLEHCYRKVISATMWSDVNRQRLLYNEFCPLPTPIRSWTVLNHDSVLLAATLIR